MKQGLLFLSLCGANCFAQYGSAVGRRVVCCTRPWAWGWFSSYYDYFLFTGKFIVTIMMVGALVAYAWEEEPVLLSEKIFSRLCIIVFLVGALGFYLLT